MGHHPLGLQTLKGKTDLRSLTQNTVFVLFLPLSMGMVNHSPHHPLSGMGIPNSRHWEDDS